MLIIARTDARQSYGFDEACERLKTAVEIGVDAVFFEALQSKDECERICKLMGDVPVMLNVVPGGVTPSLSVSEARTVGFRIIIFPVLCMGPIISSVTKELEHFYEHGQASDAGNSSKVRDAFDLCGLNECIELDKAAGGKTFSNV
jgi:2-methylisocitrate lyase-like PEP mutase family enzyme